MKVVFNKRDKYVNFRFQEKVLSERDKNIFLLEEYHRLNREIIKAEKEYRKLDE